MNAADFTIVAIVIISALFSLRRGFSAEAISLVAWIAAFIIGRTFSVPLAYTLGDLINPPSLREPVAFGILFVVTLLAAGALKRLLGSLISATGLSTMDRLLGMFFGAARGLVIVILVLGMISRLINVSQDAWWQQSVLIPHLLMMETWIYDFGQQLWQRIMG